MLFQTALEDGDRTHLLDNVRQLRARIGQAIAQRTYAKIGTNWKMLQRLRIINHPEIENLTKGEILPTIQNAIKDLIEIYQENARAYDFSSAILQLVHIQRIHVQLPGATLNLNWIP